MPLFAHRIEVRFRDCDSLGHVNNAVYLTYLEQTRINHWRSLWNFGAAHDATEPGSAAEPKAEEPMPGVILARVECDYKRPARFGQMLEVRMRVSGVGRTSFQYEYEIVDEEGRTVALAKTVQVMYDYRTGTPVPIPDGIRALLTS